MDTKQYINFFKLLTNFVKVVIGRGTYELVPLGTPSLGSPQLGALARVGQFYNDTRWDAEASHKYV